MPDIPLQRAVLIDRLGSSAVDLRASDPTLLAEQTYRLAVAAIVQAQTCKDLQAARNAKANALANAATVGGS